MNKGLIQIKSSNDFETTYAKLRKVLDDNPAIGIVAELNHQANAARVDLTLGKVRIIMFGNPRLGTPLMQAGIGIAIDLPQKMIVFEKEGEVFITFNDHMYLKSRHDIEGRDEVFEKMSGSLQKLAGVAAN